jgi:haloalkane dehalogenase
MNTDKILRTPDSRFDNLFEYDFQPNYIELQGIRIHFVDEGPKDGETILLMHGEPSWSYLYRKMIPPLVNAGYRVVAPDLPGFGRSDKFRSRKDYSYQVFVDIFSEFIEKLDLKDITIFVQDWGGLIGFRVLAEQPARFARVIATNTGFPSAKGLAGWFGYILFKLKIKLKGKVNEEELREKTNFFKWVAFSQTVSKFDVGAIIQGATITNLSNDVIDSYNAPFPDDTYKEGARILPMLVPSQLRKNRKVWENVLKKWDKPFLTAFSDKDPITRGFDEVLQKIVPGAKGQNHITIKDGGHFLQEDKGEELAEIVIKFIKGT